MCGSASSRRAPQDRRHGLDLHRDSSSSSSSRRCRWRPTSASITVSLPHEADPSTLAHLSDRPPAFDVLLETAFENFEHHLALDAVVLVPRAGRVEFFRHLPLALDELDPEAEFPIVPDGQPTCHERIQDAPERPDVARRVHDGYRGAQRFRRRVRQRPDGVQERRQGRDRLRLHRRRRRRGSVDLLRRQSRRVRGRARQDGRVGQA